METERDYKADWEFESRVSDECRKIAKAVLERNTRMRIVVDDLKGANSGLKLALFVSGLLNLFVSLHYQWGVL